MKLPCGCTDKDEKLQVVCLRHFLEIDFGLPKEVADEVININNDSTAIKSRKNT